MTRNFRILGKENVSDCMDINAAANRARSYRCDAFEFNDKRYATESLAEINVVSTNGEVAMVSLVTERVGIKRNTSQQRFATCDDMRIAYKAWLDYDSGMKLPMRDTFIDGYVLALRDMREKETEKG